MSWPPPAAARWTAAGLFLLALSLHLFLALGGTLIGLDFRTLIIVDEVGAILAAPLLFMALLRLRPGEAFGLRRAHGAHYLMALAGAVPLQMAGGAMQELMIEALPDSDAWRDMIERAMERLMEADSPLDMALLLLGAVVLAAICEELLFRGLMLRLLQRGGGWAVPILVTSVLFAAFHLDVVGFLPRTLMGVYFGLLVWRSGSVMPAILAHGANNSLAFAAVPLAGAGGEGTVSPGAVLLVALGAGLLFALLLTVYLRKAPGPLPRSPLERPAGAEGEPPAMAAPHGTAERERNRDPGGDRAD